MLSGTESNSGITFIRRFAIFNPRLALIGFPGTGARCLPYDNNFLENPNLEVHLSFLPCGAGSRQTVHSLLISPVSSLLHVQTKGFYPPSRQNRKASRPFPSSENSHFQNEA